MLSKSCFKIFV